MMRTIWGSHERCKQTYFSMFPGKYFTGDGCVRDKDGHYRITGRVDDVLNVSGHRIGTAEVENAINRHPNVVESAVVGVQHDIKGQAIHAFVIVNSAFSGDIEASIKQEVATHIGAIARPESIQVVEGLPKTRSGKIMRRILRKISEGDLETIGDTSTLLNPSVVDSIIKDRLNKEGKRV
ncbi:MAG: acetyl-coenzyme A synthetase, partial [Schleiferiaceae bacterium]|nr:acetyl-coenzyme A synthetase [Schleiferiaceae bacterium]